MPADRDARDETVDRGGRRSGKDRRVADLPFEGECRRTADRRSGEDRRASPRS
ncbi:hypothetical protein [Aurantiacibacter spongiae]|uniref:hypothetical protein n=1 Tax=Aurantiacibacter spongiae TaxID=2488860 RepID=UPI0013156B73|nr:hypothetical protein [Aurantiacibacter spongiae]